MGGARKGVSKAEVKKLIMKEFKERRIVEALAEKASFNLVKAKSTEHIDLRIKCEVIGRDVSISVEKLKPLPDDYPTLEEWLLEELSSRMKDSSA